MRTTTQFIQKKTKVMKTPHEIANEWQVFEIKYGVPPFSKIMQQQLALLGIFTIDIFKFDDYLHKKFGNYEDENKSMGEILSEKYGKDIYEYVEQMCADI